MSLVQIQSPRPKSLASLGLLLGATVSGARRDARASRQRAQIQSPRPNLRSVFCRRYVFGRRAALAALGTNPACPELVEESPRPLSSSGVPPGFHPKRHGIRFLGPAAFRGRFAAIVDLWRCNRVRHERPSKPRPAHRRFIESMSMRTDRVALCIRSSSRTFALGTECRVLGVVSHRLAKQRPEHGLI